MFFCAYFISLKIIQREFLLVSLLCKMKQDNIKCDWIELLSFSNSGWCYHISFYGIPKKMKKTKQNKETINQQQQQEIKKERKVKVS